MECWKSLQKNHWTVKAPKNKELGCELSVSVFADLYNTLGRPHLEYAIQACSLNLVADADCLEQTQRLALRVARWGFPPTAIWRTTTPAGSSRLTPVSPPWRPHSYIQNVFRRIGPQPSLFFNLPLRPGLRGHPFKVLLGPNRRLRRTSSFSTRVVKY